MSEKCETGDLGVSTALSSAHKYGEVNLLGKTSMCAVESYQSSE